MFDSGIAQITSLLYTIYNVHTIHILQSLPMHILTRGSVLWLVFTPVQTSLAADSGDHMRRQTLYQLWNSAVLAAVAGACFRVPGRTKCFCATNQMSPLIEGPSNSYVVTLYNLA